MQMQMQMQMQAAGVKAAQGAGMACALSATPLQHLEGLPAVLCDPVLEAQALEQHMLRIVRVELDVQDTLQISQAKGSLLCGGT